MRIKRIQGTRFGIMMIWVFILWPLACVEKIEPEGFAFDQLVVVDGLLTDENQLHEVKLSYTSPVESTSVVVPLSNAHVWIEDDLGVMIDFVENDAGFYQLADSTEALLGREYRLVFVTESGQGKRYESDFQKLIKSPGIERFYSRFEEQTIGVAEGSVPGLQFFVDTKSSPTGASFFRYEWNDAVQTKSPILLRFTWELADRSLGLARTVGFLGTRSVEECFELAFSDNLILGNSLSNSTNAVLEQPIAFVRKDRLDFMRRYSIEVIQYSIDSKAHSYLRQLKEFNESNGSLFDQQQGFVQGNVRSIEDPQEKVLGYFEVAGVSRVRHFFYPQELGSAFGSQFKSLNGLCSVDDIIEISMPDRAFKIDADLGFVFPLSFVENQEAFMFDLETTLNLRLGYLNNKLFLHPELDCLDCRKHGGEINKRPTYWID